MAMLHVCTREIDLGCSSVEQLLSGLVPIFRNKFQDFSRTQIDFSRTSTITLNPSLFIPMICTSTLPTVLGGGGGGEFEPCLGGEGNLNHKC